MPHECINTEIIRKLEVDLAVAQSDIKAVKDDIKNVKDDIRDVKQDISQQKWWLMGIMAAVIIELVKSFVGK
jgi:hypothetical protein